jgi:hypothetical protein
MNKPFDEVLSGRSSGRALLGLAFAFWGSRLLVLLMTQVSGVPKIDFCDALLRKQRLLVVVDRLSERSTESQDYVRNVYRSTHLGAIIVASRTPFPVDGLNPTLIFPQPLNSTSLLFFVTGLLTMLGANKQEETESSSEEKGPLARIKGQLNLGQRLASLIELRTPDGVKEIPILPLPVRLFVERAVELLATGRSLDDLPASLPDIYLQYLCQINPKPTDGARPADGVNLLTDEDMLRAAKVLGRVALEPNHVPKEFLTDTARNALTTAEWTRADSENAIERLQSNGVIYQTRIGASFRAPFSSRSYC